MERFQKAAMSLTLILTVWHRSCLDDFHAQPVAATQCGYFAAFRWLGTSDESREACQEAASRALGAAHRYDPEQPFFRGFIEFCVIMAKAVCGNVDDFARTMPNKAPWPRLRKQCSRKANNCDRWQRLFKYSRKDVPFHPNRDGSLFACTLAGDPIAGICKIMNNYNMLTHVQEGLGRPLRRSLSRNPRPIVDTRRDTTGTASPMVPYQLGSSSLRTSPQPVLKSS